MDSFPGEKSIYFGSRVGGLYPYCISRANDPPLDSPRYVKARENRVAFIKKRRLEDLGETEVDPALIERIIWEGDHGADGPGLARIMRDLAAKHPLKPGAADSLPVLPLLPDLTQAVNMGAVDSRGVIAMVLPAEGEDTMSAHMARLLFEQGIAGRTHTVRLPASEWAEAKDKKLVQGGELEAGIFFIFSHPYGFEGEVHAEVPATASEEEIRAMLTASLADFAATWRKLDRKEHIKQGVADQISWREWDPNTKSIIDIAKKETGNDKERKKGSKDPKAGGDSTPDPSGSGEQD